MRLDVAFTPGLLYAPERAVCIVIDVLRATSALVTMFGRGLAEALVAGTVAEARRQAEGRPGWLLCGEERGLAPAGFDHGNSPSEFDALDLSGKRAIVATTNGTRALTRAADCPAVLVGSMLNLRAVASAAHREADRSASDVVLMCAGQRQARSFSLEDALCAGALVEELARLAQTELSDSATAARRIAASYGGSLSAALGELEHGASLVALGLEHDLRFCAQRDRFQVVPRLTSMSDGTLRLLSQVP